MRLFRYYSLLRVKQSSYRYFLQMLKTPLMLYFDSECTFHGTRKDNFIVNWITKYA